MSLDHFQGYRRFVCAGAIVSLAMAMQGCGGSRAPREASKPLTGVDRAKVLTDNNTHKWVGEGKNKRMIELTRRDKRKLLNKAAREAAEDGAAAESK